MNKKRWTLFAGLIIGSLICGFSVLRLPAASPTEGTISPTSDPVQWSGTAPGGTSNGEETCVEGVNCDTFTLTVSGTPADWSGKTIEVMMSWVVLSSDYDMYIHKGSNDGPVVASSATGPPSTSEKATLDPSVDGTGVFTVRAVYFAASAGDQYRGTATVVTAGNPTPTPSVPPRSKAWNIVYHGTCCEGNLAASGNDTYVLLPELTTGNDILRSSDGGKTWVKKYPPVDVSEPYGIEGDLQAFGKDVIFFGTELANGTTAHSDDRGETFTVTQFPVPFVANDQAWAYLGPFEGMNPAGPLPTDEPYVLAGWFRIGSVAVFSFDGGLTYPIQTPLVGNNGSGPIHVVCRENAHEPNDAGDTRIPNKKFAKQKAGRHGGWGTDRKFYWTEPAGGELYVCKTDDFGANWTGIKHPITPGPADDFVVTHSAFDDNGTLYVMHGDKLYVSFNQGESFAFVHTMPRHGSARRGDAGADQFFVVESGTIHIAALEEAPEGNARMFYVRGIGADTANPLWQEEFVDEVGPVRLDFVQLVLNGNGIPTISYTTPEPDAETMREVTTASRKTPMPLPPAHLQNISTRGRVQPGDNVLIGGFIITGDTPKKVIVRAIGPSMRAGGEPVEGRLNDPMLELYAAGNPAPIEKNDDWKENKAKVKATSLAPRNDRESAIVRTLEPGVYTAIVRGKAGSSGIALAEVYDLSAGDGSKLANLSTRGFVETNDNAMIGGFIVGPPGTAGINVVVRGLGPSLKNRLPAALDNPTLEVRNANGALIELNDNWQQSPGAAQVQAAGLAPKKAAESAVMLPAAAPGTYTAILRGKNQTTGIGLVEVYHVP